jgi:peptide/nickel transport system permease protein
MMAWLLRRLAASVAITFAVVTFVFILIHLAPGEPCSVGEGITDPQICRQLVRQFGLDQPILVQYWRYLVELAHGNLGYSFALHRPVRDAIADTVPFTLQLAGAALLLDFALGLGLGIYQALRVNRLQMSLGNITLFVYSYRRSGSPVLLLVFGQLRLFPVGGQNDQCYARPSIRCLLRRSDLALLFPQPRWTGRCGGAPLSWRCRSRRVHANGAPRAAGRRLVLGISSATRCVLITRFASFPFLLTSAV